MSAEPTEETRRLAAALRAAASRAADRSEDGVSLVFVATDAKQRDVRLRAASGFRTADEAREMAALVLPHARDALGADSVIELPPAPAAQAAAGLLAFPLAYAERTHGVLVVGSPKPFSPAARDAIGDVARELGLRLDHQRLQSECQALREQAPPADSDEVLRLSEALFAQDIELLRSNEKLGKIERLKNDFIEKMSRELRTPLNSIIETIISVMTTENDTLSQASQEALRGALDEGSAFLRTLQNILDLWRIKQGELPVEIQDVNFRELVDEAIFSIQDGIDGKDLRIEPQLVEPFPRIRTDLAKVSQILFLLLDNATKFTPAGVVEIVASVHEGRLGCTIRDTGIGICPDDQQFVFDEFFQVDEPSSRKYPGAGLGLTLVRDLIVLLDGEIAVSSDVGRGTSVTFQIPVQVV